jgi:tRNA-modifying protein YgfZ
MTATQQLLDFKTTTSIDLAALRAGFVAPLSSFGLMSLSGADAVSFLHRQLTNDVEHLPSSQARLAGYCTPQGRLLATFLMWKANDRLLLQLPVEIQPGLQKRLQIYVLRDKVKITEATELVQIGLGGKAAGDALAPWFAQLPDQAYGKVKGEHGSLIRVADAFGTPRYLWIASAETINKVWPVLIASLKAFSDSAWKLADIDAGIPQITAATQEKFVAQMVNFELVGGVSFKKGCYPGQEIVARTQYRGKTSRKMLAASIMLTNSEATAGTDVYADDDTSQPCGMIVNAERNSPDLISCLVSLRLPIPEGVRVHLGSASGPVLHFTALPYPLPDPISGDGEHS